MEYPLTDKDNRIGIIASLLIISLWAFNLFYLLRAEVSTDQWNLVPQFFLQILLYTGLFITAHDAMHGLVSHKNRTLNNFIGQLSLSLFALFSLKKMQPKHKQHHTHPASEKDPDYHDGQNSSIPAWFKQFFLAYASWMQIISLALIYNILHHVFGIAQINLILFWLIPSLLGTFQLFYFGNYLPHRESKPDFIDEHRARSNDYPVWLSFLTCYHFGYH